jgi:hypothetical protein
VCIKLPGPKAAAQLSPSRPIPTAIDAVITAEEGLLLTFAYSRPSRFVCLNAFFKILAIEYGPSISNSSLRHAVLARTAVGLPSTQRLQILEDHKQQASEALARKFEAKIPLNDAEILAFCILALTEHECGVEPSQQLDICSRCTSLLLSISDDEPRRSLLLVFRPAFLDWLGGLQLMLSTLRRDISPSSVPPMTYSQHIQYYNHVQHVHPRLQLIHVGAIFACLGDLAERSVCYIHRIAIRMAYEIEPALDDKATAALLDIRIHLSNLERGRISREAAQIEDPLLATQLVQYEAQMLDGIHFTLSLSEAPSILEGFLAARTRSMGRRLISSLKTLTPRTAPLSEHFFGSLYNAQLLLSGMTLQPQEVPECNHPFFLNDTN